MPQPKRKPTHIKPAVTVNSKKRGKVETTNFYITENSMDDAYSNTQPSSSTSNSDVPTPTVTDLDTDNLTKQQSNIYYDRKQKEVDAWAKLRSVAVDGLLEGYAPISQKCIVCQEYSDAPVRCIQCSTTYIACGNCARKDHQTRPFHYLEIWQVCCYKCIMSFITSMSH